MRLAFKSLLKTLAAVIPLVCALLLAHGPSWTPLDDAASDLIRGGGITYSEDVYDDCEKTTHLTCGEIACQASGTYDPENPEHNGLDPWTWEWHYLCPDWVGPGYEDFYGEYTKCNIGVNQPYQTSNASEDIVCYNVYDCATGWDESCGEPVPGRSHPDLAYCLNGEGDPYPLPRQKSTCSGAANEE